MRFLIDLPPYVEKDWNSKVWDFRTARPGNYIHPEGYLEPHRRFIQMLEDFPGDKWKEERERRIKGYNHREQIKAAWACSEALEDDEATALFVMIEGRYRHHEKYGDAWVIREYPALDKLLILEVEERYRINCKMSRLCSGMPPKEEE